MEPELCSYGWHSVTTAQEIFFYFFYLEMFS